MPTHMNRLFTIEELKTTELAEPFSFTKGCKTMKIKAREIEGNLYMYGTQLFDLQNDPTQEHPIIDAEIEKRMIKLLVEDMKKSDAPLEQYERLGIPMDGNVTNDHLRLDEKYSGIKGKIGDTEITWRNKGKSMYYLVLKFTPEHLQMPLIQGFEAAIKKQELKEVDEDFLFEVFMKFVPANLKPFMGMITDLVKKKAK
jgi:hypothetical protein